VDAEEGAGSDDGISGVDTCATSGGTAVGEEAVDDCDRCTGGMGESGGSSGT